MGEFTLERWRMAGEDLLMVALSRKTVRYAASATIEFVPTRVSCCAGVVNIGRWDVLEHTVLAGKLEEDSLARAAPLKPPPARSLLWIAANRTIQAAPRMRTLTDEMCGAVSR